MTKTLDQYFADWEGSAFGFGYGTGEAYIIPALCKFFAAVGEGQEKDRAHCYDHERLEAVLGGEVAWLLINTLCRADIIEYGTSPRFGWLTSEGERLRDYFATKTADELYEIVTEKTEEYLCCYPDACNCGPGGYQKGVKCQNPFWPNRE